MPSSWSMEDVSYKILVCGDHLKPWLTPPMTLGNLTEMLFQMHSKTTDYHIPI